MEDSGKERAVAGTVRTSTWQEAVRSPSTDVAVILALPSLRAVTKPPLTEATSDAELLQRTLLLAALSGWTVAVSRQVFPMLNWIDSSERVTPVTAPSLPEGVSCLSGCSTPPQAARARAATIRRR